MNRKLTLSSLYVEQKHYNNHETAHGKAA